MEKVISNDDRVAIAEVDYIIHHMNDRYLSKIPQKVVDYITILKKRNVEIYVDPRVPLEKQGLKEFTLYFIMILNLKYWCNDERRKDILSMMENNQKKFDDRISNIFEQAENLQGDSSKDESREINKPKQVVLTNNISTSKEETISEPNSSENILENLKEETSMMGVKENFFKKFINKIKSILVKSKQ